MEPPAREPVEIEPAKVRDYLLSKEHPVGHFKAAFFEALGYSAAEWQRLDATSGNLQPAAIWYSALVSGMVRSMRSGVLYADRRAG
ncbi:MAG: DUF6883 domain-containing protein [Candidatus Binatia bacterium]